MTRTNDVPVDERFGWGYRIRTAILFNLLSVAGPAQLESHNDPRSALEQDYERRHDLHRLRQGKPPLAKKPRSSGGIDVFVLSLAAVGLAVVLLLVWAVLSSR